MELPEAPELFLWILAALYAIDKTSAALGRVVAKLGRMGRLPDALKGWDRRRAHALIEDERKEGAMKLLLQHSDEILTAVTITGNGGVADRVKKIEETLDQMATNVTSHVADSAADSSLLLNVDRALAEHMAETAPLVEQYKRDLEERGAP